MTFLLLAYTLNYHQSIHKYATFTFSFHSVLHLCHDLVLLSQPRYAHEVHDTS